MNRGEQVAALKQQGLSFVAIGEALGITKQGAHDAWKRWLRRAPVIHPTDQLIASFEQDVIAMRSALYRGKTDTAASVARAMAWYLHHRGADFDD